MANSASKGLTIGIVALVVIAAVAFVLTRGPGTNPEVVNATSAAAKTETPSEAKAESDAKPEPKADSKDLTAAGQGETDGADLTSPTSSEEVVAAKPDTAADAKEEKKEEKAESSSEGESLLSGPEALDVDIDKATADRSMGRDDAPVVMIEYASMTCPHCAHFSNDLLPKLKPLLIDSGKLRLIFRDYPLDTYAMKAAMMARCADPAKYFDLIEVLFKNQERWVKAADPVKGLVQLGALAGMNEDFINACIKNEELQSAILAKVQEAQKNYKLNSTPTFVFNSGAEIMSGDKEVEDFVNVVNRLIRK